MKCLPVSLLRTSPRAAKRRAPVWSATGEAPSLVVSAHASWTDVQTFIAII